MRVTMEKTDKNENIRKCQNSHRNPYSSLMTDITGISLAQKISNFSNFLHSNSYKLVVFCGRFLTLSTSFPEVQTQEDQSLTREPPCAVSCRVVNHPVSFRTVSQPPRAVSYRVVRPFRRWTQLPRCSNNVGGQRVHRRFSTFCCLLSWRSLRGVNMT